MFCTSYARSFPDEVTRHHIAFRIIYYTLFTLYHDVLCGTFPTTSPPPHAALLFHPSPSTRAVLLRQDNRIERCRRDDGVFSPDTLRAMLGLLRRVVAVEVGRRRRRRFIYGHERKSSGTYHFIFKQMESGTSSPVSRRVNVLENILSLRPTRRTPVE